jgi:hypothetical protein
MSKPKPRSSPKHKSRRLQELPVIAKEEAMWLSKGMQTGEPVSFTAVESESHPVTRVKGVKSQCHLSFIRSARIRGVLALASLKEDAFTDANISFLHQVAHLSQRSRVWG